MANSLNSICVENNTVFVSNFTNFSKISNTANEENSKNNKATIMAVIIIKEYLLNNPLNLFSYSTKSIPNGIHSIVLYQNAQNPRHRNTTIKKMQPVKLYNSIFFLSPPNILHKPKTKNNSKPICNKTMYWELRSICLRHSVLPNIQNMFDPKAIHMISKSCYRIAMVELSLRTVF